MRPRAVTSAVIAVLGAVAFAAGVAWPRDPLTAPTRAGAAAPAPSPVSKPTSSAPASPTATATTPGNTPSTVDSPAPTNGPPPPVPGWTLVDYDNFDGTKLSGKRWNVYDSPATNHVSRWSPSMVSVAGGELRIAGQGRDPSGAGNVSGGLCWCKGDQAYGMWQVRARFERGAGYGQVILLWPESNTWPDDGELDLAETPHPDKRSMVQTIHWGTSSDQQLDDKWVDGDFAQWHVYSVIWRPGLVQLLVDDKVYYDSGQSKRHPQVPSKPMHLAIQQEPGPFNPTDWVPAPNASTPDQVTLHVDWVRLYR